MRLKRDQQMQFLKEKFQPIIILLTIIWIVEIVNLIFGRGLNSWGILPRSFGGLIGIPLAPFLHGSLWHAISNTIPLAILGGLVLATGPKRYWETTIWVTLFTGILIWVFARSAYHIGASGLVFGYFGILVGRAIIEKSFISVVAGVVTVMLYGGLLWGILPSRSYISFESHLFGLIAGIFVVWLDNRLNRASSD